MVSFRRKSTLDGSAQKESNTPPVNASPSGASIAMADYDNVPENAILQPSRFRVKIPQQQLNDMKQLLKLSKLGPKTFENLEPNGKYGMSLEWLAEAKEYWETKYDWRSTESHINTFTQYEVVIKDDTGAPFAIHFTGMFSKHEDAIPVMLLHGWPGSFLEFYKLLQRLQARYSPEELPYHIIVPSLPGYAFSTGPPLDREWACEDAAAILHKLMVGLGFESGYTVHGGDLGSMIARIMAVRYDACKAIHLNFCLLDQAPESVSESALVPEEKEGLAKAQYFSTLGNSYAREHGQRPSTIGLVLSTNPLALLAWIGEKFLEWTDISPSVEAILESVTLYWLTATFPRSLYPYVQFFGDSPRQSYIHPDPRWHCRKPMGYSWFPKELAPMPIAWVATTGNLVWSRRHASGGHFAAMEKPDELLKDIEEFIDELR